MKFIKETPPYGTRRTRTKFLWWPKKITTKLGGIGDYRYERRWLETASWEEQWTAGRYSDWWEPKKFLDGKEGLRRNPLVGADE